MNPGSNTFRNALEKAGIKTTRKRAKTFLPDFQIGDYHFFELRKRWSLGHLCDRHVAFRSKMICFIQSKAFLTEREMLCLDCTLGIDAMLYLYEGGKLHQVVRENKKWELWRCPLTEDIITTLIPF